MAPSAVHSGNEGGNLDVGDLEDGLQLVGEPCPLVDQVDEIAGEVRQVALSRLRPGAVHAGPFRSA